MNRTTAAILAGLLAAVPAVAFAQPNAPPDSAAVRGESAQTRTRLAEAEQKLLAGKTADALDDLLRILDEAGDDLVTADGRSYYAARRYVHRFLAKLPPDVLKTYRDRVEEAAGKLLATGRTLRDPRPLHQLLDRYAVSRPAEDALLLLGELAFERSEFVAAERHWRGLLPDADPPFPAPRTDPAVVRAKVVLAAVFQGDSRRAAALLAEFREKHPNAEGAIAGKTGALAEILQGLLAAPPRVRPDTLGGGIWTTLGGNPARDGRVNGRFSYYFPSGPTWTAVLPRDPAAADRSRWRSPPVGAVRSVAFHPVVLGDRAYVADAGRVIGIDLRTGAAAVVFDGRNLTPVPAGDLKLPVPFEADYALTGADGRLYARVGPAALFPTPDARRPSRLVCLTPAGEVVWSRTPPAPDGVPASWEGAPLVFDGRVVALFARSEGGRLIHAVAGYDGPGDRPAWVTDLTDAGAIGAETRTRHELLTLAGRNVVFCSHAGAVVAVNARTGTPAWAFRYPRVPGLPADGRHRDICPPVAADGRVFVAPNDSDHLFAFDADTGGLLWEDGPIAVNHLIGAAGGKAVAAVAGPNRGVRAYDAATGSTDPPLGWANHDDPMLTTFGRGLLTDDGVLWPTPAGVSVLRLADGLPLRRDPLPGPHGNLAYANGVLVVGTPTEVWGYVPGDMPQDSPSAPPRITVADSTPLPPPPDRPQLPPAVRLPAAAEPVEPPPRARSAVGRFGDHLLVGYDRTGDRVTWRLDGLKRSRDWPFGISTTPRFTPHAYLDESRLVAQTTAARRLLIDATTGTVIDDAPTARRPWAAPPARAGELVVLADGPGVVTAIDPARGAPVWRFDAGREPSQSGEAAQVIAADGSVFVAVARNHGVEIERLIAADGARLWPAGPAFLPVGSLDLTAAAADAERLYVPLPGRLAALRLDTGRELWDAPLPDANGAAGWRAVMTRNVLLVHPGEAIPAEPLAAVGDRLLRSFARRPDPRRLFGLLATAFEAWYDRTLPVLLFDPGTGRLQQRLDLPARGPAAAVRVAADGVTVTAGAAAYRLK